MTNMPEFIDRSTLSDKAGYVCLDHWQEGGIHKEHWHATALVWSLKCAEAWGGDVIICATENEARNIYKQSNFDRAEMLVMAQRRWAA